MLASAHMLPGTLEHPWPERTRGQDPAPAHVLDVLSLLVTAINKGHSVRT